MMDRLYLVLARIDPDLQIQSSHVIRTSQYSLLVDLVVLGPALSRDSWRIDGLGSRPVVVTKFQPQRSTITAVRVLPTAPVPAPKRALTNKERLSWAEIARGVAMETSPLATPASPSLPPTLPLPDTAASASPAQEVIPDDAEIPLRRKGRASPSDAAPLMRPRAPVPAAAAGRSRPQPTTPKDSASKDPRPNSTPQKPRSSRRREPTITEFLAPAPKPPAPPRQDPHPRAECNTYLGLVRPSPSSAPPTVPQPPIPVPTIDVASFTVLAAQVEILTKQLAEQQALNQRLQADLSKALLLIGDLSNQLKTVKPKRARAASTDAATGSSSPTSDSAEASMYSPAELEEPALTRRRSPEQSLGRGNSPNE